MAPHFGAEPPSGADAQTVRDSLSDVDCWPPPFFCFLLFPGTSQLSFFLVFPVYTKICPSRTCFGSPPPRSPYPPRSHHLLFFYLFFRSPPTAVLYGVHSPSLSTPAYASYRCWSGCFFSVPPSVQFRFGRPKLSPRRTFFLINGIFFFF